MRFERVVMCICFSAVSLCDCLLVCFVVLLDVAEPGLFQDVAQHFKLLLFRNGFRWRLRIIRRGRPLNALCFAVSVQREISRLIVFSRDAVLAGAFQAAPHHGAAFLPMTSSTLAADGRIAFIDANYRPFVYVAVICMFTG